MRGWLAVSMVSVADLTLSPALLKMAASENVAGFESVGCSSTWYLCARRRMSWPAAAANNNRKKGNGEGVLDTAG